MATRAYSEIRTGNTVIRLDMRELERIMETMPRKADQIVRSTAFQAEGYMKQEAPYETTALRNSIHVKTRDYDGSGNAIAAALNANPNITIADWPAPNTPATARVGPAVEYAIYQEFGTSRQAGKPFVIPGLERAYSDFQRAFTDLVK